MSYESKRKFCWKPGKLSFVSADQRYGLIVLLFSEYFKRDDLIDNFITPLSGNQNSDRRDFICDKHVNRLKVKKTAECDRNSIS